MCVEKSFEAWPRHGGFTLVELLVVVTLTAVLVIIAVPSFKDLIERNRIAGEINSLVSDLQFARSEAIKRGRTQVVCVSSSGTACMDADTWHSGWIVFSDDDGSGTLNGAEKIIRIRTGFTGGDTFTAVPNLTQVRFSRDGFAINLAASTMTLRTASLNSAATRCLELNAVGRQVVQKPGTGACS